MARSGNVAAVIALCATICVVHGADVDNRPVVGVLTLPNYFPQWADKRSYFPASYVKWLESGGTRVVPIPYTMNSSDVETLFESLNGVLFTGGGAWFLNHTTKNGQLTPYAATGKLLFDLVLKSHERGVDKPLWATCLGFELLLFLASGQNHTVLREGFNALDLPLALDLLPAAQQSRMLGDLPPGVLTTLTTQNSTFNDHQKGSLPGDFLGCPLLTSRLRPLSTNVDRDGAPFVSTVEGVNGLPLFGTQWHPEKPQYEWDPKEQIPHDAAAVFANGHFAQFFGLQCRQNSAAFPSAAAADAHLIYNYQPVYTAAVVPGFEFEQCYFFD